VRTRPLWIHADAFPSRCMMLAACLGLVIAVGCQREATPPAKGPVSAEPETKPEPAKTDDSASAEPDTGIEVFRRMIDAYHAASSYADAGTLRLRAEAGGQKLIDQISNYSVTLDRPNKLRLLAYRAMLVCDGNEIQAAIESIPNQVLAKPAPVKASLNLLRMDPNLAMAIGDFAGPPPPLFLLLSEAPMKTLLRDTEEPTLIKSGQIEGRDCYRVQIKRPDGVGVFWIDQETFVLRRIVFPTDDLRRNLTQGDPLDLLSLVADFPGARLDGDIDPKAFEFQAPDDAEVVKFFIPPNPAQLLNQKVPDFKFFDFDGKPVTPESLADKVAVLDFWSLGYEPCQRNLPNLEKVYQKYKDNPKVVFYAVSVDPQQARNEDLAGAVKELKVGVPILRDTEKSVVAFKVGEYPTTFVPTTFIVDDKGIVQDYESDGNPKLADMLSAKLDKVLAGEDIYEAPLKLYHEQLDQLKQYAEMLAALPESPSGDGTIVREEKLPEVKTAERSEPATMKLSPLWECTDLKSPGNILVVQEKAGSMRLFVVDEWNSVAEIGLDGKVIARHELEISDKEVVGNLRTAVGADGKRYFVAFLASQQRCHVFDENWKLVTHYPENALEKPHGGIADVQLGNLDGDAALKLYVSYWGVVGVQSASLEGKRLWSNRLLSNVSCITIGGADQKGRRDLFCANNSSAIGVLDAQGERRGEIKIPNRVFFWITSADLRGDGKLLWCGMAPPRLGESIAVGFSPNGVERWDYTLPQGVQRQPIEPIVAGRITRDGPGQWILPGPDGSIHILSADGKPLDKFNYGLKLQGLATIMIDGQPAFIVAASDGLKAWRVE